MNPARIFESLKRRYAASLDRTEESQDHRKEVARLKALLNVKTLQLQSAREAAEIVRGEHRREVEELQQRIERWAADCAYLQRVQKAYTDQLEEMDRKFDETGDALTRKTAEVAAWRAWGRRAVETMLRYVSSFAAVSDSEWLDLVNAAPSFPKVPIADGAKAELDAAVDAGEATEQDEPSNLTDERRHRYGHGAMP